MYTWTLQEWTLNAMVLVDIPVCFWFFLSRNLSRYMYCLDMKKIIWYKAEQLVADYYSKQWRTLLAQNRTIRGGEIDIVLENNQERCFVEVKCSNYLDDFWSLLTRKKKFALKRAVFTYMSKHPTQKKMRIDVVFVAENNIVQLFENEIL